MVGLSKAFILLDLRLDPTPAGVVLLLVSSVGLTADRHAAIRLGMES